MGFLDKLFGRRDNEEDEQQRQWEQQRQQDELRRGTNATRPIGGAPGSGFQPQRGGPGPNPQQMTDEQAVERYRYMLRTAPPETLEQAHAEAFSQLTPQQRQMVLQELTKTLPEHERRTQYSDDPQSLARMATRAELRQPGTMERTFSGVGGAGGTGIGLGGLMAGSFFSSFAGMMVGSMVASAFFGGFGGGDGNYGDGYQEGYQDAQNADGGDTGGETGGDYGTDAGGYGDAAAAGGADYGGGGDYAGGDFGGGDFGGFGGGDFGGDFGGGDFGGGDF
jgi:hypothetical protein